MNNIYKIDYQIRTLKDDCYEESKNVIERYQKDEFKNKIKTDDFDIEEFGIDNFYIISYNLILSNLQTENSDFNIKFFKNICEPLFKEYKLLFKAIELFYDPTKYREIKKGFNINANNIKAILFGYRYCLNELSFKNERGIYYPLYDINNYKNYLKEQYYPGNDIKPNKIYSSIINHFNTKPNEGCYVCLCKKGGFYHSVKSGFPNFKHMNMTCPKCSKNIGTTKAFFRNEPSIVKRDDYYRIFKSDEEIKKLKKNEEKKNKLKEINYMTLEDYKKKYVDNAGEKGVFMNQDKNYFKNDKKIIRNLSQISFRLLNYILYSHLFFARLLTNKKEDFNKYLPKEMNWVDTLYECWNILKNELLKENIDSIEKFMSYIFSDLFPILNKEKKIDNYKTLIEFENKLESLIREIIKNIKKVIIKIIYPIIVIKILLLIC